MWEALLYLFELVGFIRIRTLLRVQHHQDQIRSPLIPALDTMMTNWSIPIFLVGHSHHIGSLCDSQLLTSHLGAAILRQNEYLPAPSSLSVLCHLRLCILVAVTHMNVNVTIRCPSLGPDYFTSQSKTASSLRHGGVPT